MQPCSREMQSMNLSLLNQNQQISLHDLHHFDTTSAAVSGGAGGGSDDFLDQIFSTNSWPPPLDPNSHLSAAVKPPQSPWDPVGSMEDQSSFLAAKLRQHQIGGAKALILQQQLMLSRGLAAATAGNGLRSPGSGGANGLLPMLSGNADQSDVMLDGTPFKSANSGNEVASVQALFNGFNGGSLGQTASQTPHFHHPQNFNAPPVMNQAAAASGSTAAGVGGGGAATAGQPRQQRVRARRGQATDPHSIAERLRRERIAERMKALQELVPNANKTDKASMLDEIIDYVKFLQLQVKVLSMSRLGGAAAVAPLVADMSSEGGNERSNNGTQTASSSDSMTVTEHQVAKLMEEDMGSAMQYLQGKGLCLMPISLATAISSATCHSRNPMIPGRSGPTSPSMSGLTVQSATVVNGGAAEPAAVKDAVSVSKP